MNKIYSSFDGIQTVAESNRASINNYYTINLNNFNVGICCKIDNFIYLHIIDYDVKHISINGYLEVIDDIVIVTDGCITYEK